MTIVELKDEDLKLLEETLGTGQKSGHGKIDFNSQIIEQVRVRAMIEQYCACHAMQFEARKLAVKNARMSLYMQRMFVDIVEHRARLEERKGVFFLLSSD